MELINVICATYNQSYELEKTIKSFQSQSYKNKRLIIIDGGSTDGFDKLAVKYRNVISYVVSEPDRGISDAFNKGVKESLPGYVYFLGAGDGFVSENSLELLVENTNHKDNILVCGKVKRVDLDSGKVLGISPKTTTFHKHSLLLRMSLPHQGLLTSTLYFEKYGNFREDCKFAMDYEHLLRSYQCFPKVIVKDVLVAEWMSGGVGTGKIREVLREYDYIKRINNVLPKIILRFINLLIVSKFYFNEFLNARTKS